MENPGFDLIKLRYEAAFSQCLQREQYHISAFIENWPSVLNKIQTIVYGEIKSAGIRLYPLYPIGEDFINFGNPFKKIGIEIYYKTNGFVEKQAKLERIKNMGWKVYTFESKHSSITLEN